MDEFIIRNQIITLLYELLEKHPEAFSKLDDNTVNCFIDISPKIDLQSRITGRIIELKIVKAPVGSIFLYTLYAIGGGDIYFKYEIAELDSKTAYKFFQTDQILRKQDDDFKLIRDSLLNILGK